MIATLVLMLGLEAAAQQWAPPVRVRPGEPITLYAGRSAQVHARHGVDVRAVDARTGEEIALASDGQTTVVPAALVTRDVVFDSRGPLRVRLEDNRRVVTRWIAWERDALQAIARGAPIPGPPDPLDGGWERVELARQALGADGARAVLHQVLSTRRPLRAGRRGTRVVDVALGPDADWVLDWDGRPGTLRLSLTNAETPRKRGLWRLTIDGVPTEIPVLRGVAATRDVQIPAGASEIRVSADAPWTGTASVGRPMDWLWVQDRAATEPPGTPSLHTAAGIWAWVRLLETADGDVELPTEIPTNPVWRAVLINAVLTRTEQPLIALGPWLEAADPSRLDPAVAAPVLDRYGPRLPAGLAWLEARAALAPVDRDEAVEASLHRLAWTYWSQLPLSEDETVHRRFVPDGVGITRWALDAGQVGEETVQTGDPELRELRKLTVVAGTEVEVDGRQYRADADATWRIGLPEGPHRWVVTAGEVRMATPLAGSHPVVEERWAADGDARFVIPGAGVPASIRPEALTSDTLVLETGDGLLAQVSRRPDGSWPVIAVGPEAGWVSVQAAGPIRALVRLGRGGAAAGVPDAAGSVADLEALTSAVQAVDAGTTGARGARAVQLAAAGRRPLAWQDVALGGGASASSVRAIPVRTLDVGPLDAATGLGHAGVADPGTPEARFEAAQASGEPSAIVHAALDVGAWIVALQAALEVPELRSKIERGLRFSAVTRVDRGGGLQPVTVDPAVERNRWSQRLNDAWLAAPWGRDEAVVLSPGDRDVLSLRDRAGTVSVFCRDHRGLAESCTVPVFVDGVAQTLTIADGAVAELDATGSEIEVGPVEPDRRLVVRASDANGLIAPQVRRLALVVDGLSEVTVAGESVLRLEVGDGDVAWRLPPGAQTWTTDGRQYALLPAEGPQLVRLQGSGVVWLGRGVWEPPAPPVEPVALDAVPERLRRPLPPTVRTQRTTAGQGGTVRGGLAGVAEADGQFGRPWGAGELSVDWLRGERRWWAQAGAWGRGPGLAAGARVEVAPRWRTGFAALRGHASTTGPGAGVAGGRLLVRQDVPLGRAWTIRAHGTGRLDAVSLQPRVAVDPRGWSLYRLRHWRGVDADLSAIWRPAHDLRVEWTIDMAGNADLTVDRLSGLVDVDLLLSRRLVVGADLGVDRTFADVHRAQGAWRLRAAAVADYSWWVTDTRRWSLIARGDWVAETPGASVSLRYLWTPRRGLRDIPPTGEWFRTEREAP